MSNYHLSQNVDFTKGRKSVALLPYGNNSIIISKEKEEVYEGITQNKQAGDLLLINPR